MGTINEDDVQKNLSRYMELGDAIYGNSIEEVEQKVNEMEAIFGQYLGKWGIMERFPTEKMADGMCRLGQEYCQLEQYRAALSYYKQAEVYYSMAFGPQSLPVAECSVWLGLICHELGNYTESLKWCMDALVIRENLQNAGFQENLQIYFTIARNYTMKGNYMAAEELFMEIYENTEDKNYQAEVFRNMGILCDKQGDNRNALTWFMKAVKIKEELYGTDSLDAAGLYNSIGIIFCNIEKYVEAEEYLMRALVIKEELLSPNSISLSNTYHQLGYLETRREQLTKALEWHQKSLNIRVSALDARHPLIADSFLSIGGIYIKAEDYRKALDYNLKALEIYTQSLGKNHKHTKAVMDNVRKLETKIQIVEGE